MLTLAGKPLAVPVLQGGMGVGVSLGGLAGAVAACGGMGCISTADTGYREPDFARDPYAANLRALKKEIAKAKEIANGAGLVAINAMVATQNYADAVRTAVEAGVDAIVSGAGLPLELPGLVERADVALAPIVSSGRAAKLILRRWAKAFNRTAVITKADDDSINTLEDLKGKKTANTISSTYAELAEQYGATVTGVDDLNQTFELLLSGRIDATLNAEMTFYDYTKEHPDANVKIAVLTDDANQIAIPMRKGDETAALRTAIDAAIDELRADGTLKALSEKYFGTDISTND